MVPNLINKMASNGFQQAEPGIIVLSKVRLDHRQKSITFPAVLNLNRGLIEYVIVTQTGKTHESLLRTEAEPYQIHAAMLLLNAKGAGPEAFAEPTAQPLRGDKLTIELSWKTKPARTPVSRLILNRQTKTAMEDRWVYTGSHMEQGRFVAQRDGSIVSLINDRDALMNYTGPSRDNDENWEIIPQDLPPLGTEAEVTIKLE